MSAPLVSVVTPVYNGARYLSECIESVLAQTYSNWEYVLLDNASTDGTAEIIDRFARSDPRIRPHRNDRTLPIIENWNAALGLIDPGSRFCKVVHADDLLLPECLARMVDAGQRHPTAAIIAAYRIDGRRVNMAALPYPEDFVAGREICRRRLLGLCEDPWGSPTSVMYRSEDVRRRGDFYNLDNLHADTDVCFDLLRDADYAFVHQVLTFTRHHVGAETPRARLEGTIGMARLKIARKYGPDFLDAKEQAKAVGLQLGYHYDFLGSNAGRLLRDADFRHRQVEALEQVGLPLERGRLALASVKMAAKKAQRKVGPWVRQTTGGW